MLPVFPEWLCLCGCAGKWGYYASGAYGSLAMAIFMVKTMKRVIFQETRAYGEHWQTPCFCRVCAQLVRRGLVTVGALQRSRTRVGEEEGPPTGKRGQHSRLCVVLCCAGLLITCVGQVKQWTPSSSFLVFANQDRDPDAGRCVCARLVAVCQCVGTDMRLANYLLLALAAFQFPFSFLLAYRPV